MDGAIWFVDQTGVDAAGKGAKLRRIDPATNEPDAGVDLPFLNGFLLHSETTLFYWDGAVGWYRLRAGDTAFEDFGIKDYGAPGGDLVWLTAENGTVAQSHGGPGGPTRTVSIDGSLVAADAGALYLSRSGQGPETLWSPRSTALPPRRFSRARASRWARHSVTSASSTMTRC